MIEIMAYHHNEYVPLVKKEIHVTTEIVTLNAQVKLKASEMHCILFGGDQLTAARAHSAKRHVANADSNTGKLHGLIPVTEDWHTKMSLLLVSTK